MEASSVFNHVTVIESLPESDSKTGQWIYDDRLLHLNSVYPPLTSELIQLTSSAEFVECLRSLCLRVESERFIPLLHIECHGDKDGLQMGDGSHLPWNTLKNELINLNRATHFNLLLVVGACNGAYLIDTASHMDGAPFFGVIGAKCELNPEELKQRFSNFYKVLFESDDANKAMDSINENVSDESRHFMFLGARSFFAEGFRAYFQQYCRGKPKKARTELLVSRVLQDAKVKRLGIKFARNEVKKHLANPKNDFEFFRNRFFFADDIPNIFERLPLDYEKVINGSYA